MFVQLILEIFVFLFICINVGNVTFRILLIPPYYHSNANMPFCKYWQL